MMVQLMSHKKNNVNKAMIPFVALSIITIILVIVNMYFANSTVYADVSLDDIEKELGSNVDNRINDLQLGELQQFVDGLDDNSTFTSSIKNFIKGIIKGDYKGGYTDYFSLSMRAITSGLVDVLPIIVTVVAIAVIFSIISNMSSGFVNKSTTEIIYFVCYCAMIIIVVAKVTQLIHTTVKTLSTLQSLMNVIFPILLTLVTALGGAVSVSTYQPIMAVLSTGIVSAINAVIIPCFIATTVLSIVGNLTSNIRLNKLTKFFKTVGEVLLGIMFSLFMTFVTMQGITGAVADNVSVRSAKFAISSYVPILGGYLSEGFDLVMASVVLVKNALGFTGVIAMLSVCLVPIMSILCFSLGLKLAAGIIEPIGDKRMSDTVYGISKNMVLLVVAVLGVSFMFFIMIMLVIYTCNLGV